MQYSQSAKYLRSLLFMVITAEMTRNTLELVTEFEAEAETAQRSRLDANVDAAALRSTHMNSGHSLRIQTGCNNPEIQVTL